MNSELEPIILDSKPRSQKITGNVIFAASVAVIGSSFQFGYNTGVINAPELIIEQFYNQTYLIRYHKYISATNLKVLWALTVSIFAVGGMFGSFLAGYMANYFGRRKSLLINNLFAIVGVLLMTTSKLAGSYEMIILGRFVIGINCGLNTGLAPLYLTEIAPIEYRGMFGTLNQMGVVTALLLSQILGLPQVLGNSVLWPILFAVPALFGFYQVFGLKFCVDSPSYLFGKGMHENGIEALVWLRGTGDIEEDIQNIRSEQSNNSETFGFVQLIKNRCLFQPLIVAIVMQCSQQLSGINAVFYYSTSIFVAAGVPVVMSTYITVGMGVANVVMTTISVSLIEKVGRRTLHLIGLGGMFFCAVGLVFSLTLGIQWVSAVAVILFVIFFQTGPGSIPWFITAELFDEAARPTAISIAGLVNWTGNFIVGIAYPPLALAIHGYTFIIFAILLFIFFVFTYFKVPETKGKTIHEISLYFDPSAVKS
uniref:Solute carrier family 2, facilitated glucose transporter member 5 n=1 Tax=Phallusia mammillata TaxID=59560 RepID=A0A6F9DTA2_9ASCI|nr:solute carrier family 2, facilitated glucose transporter member 1-like [Phallusia mammillata]